MTNNQNIMSWTHRETEQSVESQRCDAELQYKIFWKWIMFSHPSAAFAKHCSFYFSTIDQYFWLYSSTYSAVNREQKWYFFTKQISLLHPLILSWEKPTKSTLLQWQWTCVRTMGYQIKDKCVITSTLTYMHSRAVLLKKELMNPLLQIIRKVHKQYEQREIATVQIAVQ